MAKNDKVSQARKAFVKARVQAFVTKNPGATVNDIQGIRIAARQRFAKLAASVEGRTKIVQTVGEPGSRKDLRSALKTQFTPKVTTTTTTTTSSPTTTSPTTTSGTGSVSERDATSSVGSRSSATMPGITRDSAPYRPSGTSQVAATTTTTPNRNYPAPAAGTTTTTGTKSGGSNAVKLAAVTGGAAAVTAAGLVARGRVVQSQRLSQFGRSVSANTMEQLLRGNVQASGSAAGRVKVTGTQQGNLASPTRGLPSTGRSAMSPGEMRQVTARAKATVGTGRAIDLVTPTPRTPTANAQAKYGVTEPSTFNPTPYRDAKPFGGGGGSPTGAQQALAELLD